MILYTITHQINTPSQLLYFPRTARSSERHEGGAIVDDQERKSERKEDSDAQGVASCGYIFVHVCTPIIQGLVTYTKYSV